MPRKVTIEGKNYIFKDGTTAAEIQQELESRGVIPRIKTKVPVDSDAVQAENPSFLDKTLEFIRPIAAPIASTVTKTAVSGTPAAPLALPAGIAAGLATDQGIQLLQGAARSQSLTSKITDVPKGGVVDRMASTAEMAGLNYVGGKIAEPLFKGAKGVLTELSGNSVVSPLIAELGGTFSAYAQRPVAEFIENVFARSAKLKALANSAEAIKTKGADIARSMTGHGGNKVETAQLIQTELKSLHGETVRVADQQFVNAENIAKLNPFTYSVPSGIPTVPPTLVKVDGPIDIERAVRWADNFLKERARNLVPPGEDAKLAIAAKNIILSSKAQFDSTGKIVAGSVKPIGYADAVAFKKQAQELGYGTVETSFTKTHKGFQELDSVLDSEIEGSMTRWGNNAYGAIESYANGKGALAAARSIFSTGDTTTKLVNTLNSPVPEVSRIIADPKKLQRALSAGSISVKSVGGAGEFTVTNSTNLRKGLQGYKFMEIMEKAWIPAEPGKAAGHFNQDVLMKSWMDPTFTASKNILYNKAQQQTIDEFFNAVSKVSTPIGNSGNIAAKIRIAGASAFLGSKLLQGSLSSLVTTPSAVVVGGSIGLSGLGKIFTEPKAAKLLTAFVTGAPLGMSEQLAAKTILGALQGVPMTLSLEGGQEKQVQIKDGKIVP